MSETIEIAAGTYFMLGGHLAMLNEAADFVIPDAIGLDSVAEILAASARRQHDPSGLSARNLALNVGVLDRQVVAPAGGLGGYDAGTALDITYGPRGQREYTTQGLVPTLLTAVVEDAAPTILVLTFSADVNSVANDYLLGFSCSVDAAPVVINPAARQANNAVLHLTLAGAVLEGEVVLVSFNSALSDIESDTGAKLQSFAGVAVTNNVAA